MRSFRHSTHPVLPASIRRGLCGLLLALGAALAQSDSRLAHAQLGVDVNRRYDQNSFLGTHNSYATSDYWYVAPNQAMSITDQLKNGVRLINLDTWMMKEEQIAGLFSALIWHYDGSTWNTRPGYSHDGPPQIKVAHDPWTWLYLPIGGPAHNFVNLWNHDPNGKGALNEIRRWLEANPGEIVTLTIENNVPAGGQSLHDSMYERAFATVDGSGNAGTLLFYLDRPNPGMPAPDGRPGNWDVRKHGFPTLAKMVASGKRVVLLPDDGRVGGPNPWLYQVNTVYGKNSLDGTGNPQTWTNARGNTSAIDDFSRPLFLMEHAPDLPCGEAPACADFHNSFDYGVARKLRYRWDDIRQRWDRIPQLFSCDFFDRGHPGPKEFVQYLNSEWANSVRFTFRAPVIRPAPTRHGWNNSDVTVSDLWGAADGREPRRLVMTTYRDFPYVRAPDQLFTEFDAFPAVTTSQPGSVALSREGINTVSYALISPTGTLGERSDQRFVDVRIDKTPPKITGEVHNAPNAHGWYKEDLVFRFDLAETEPIREVDLGLFGNRRTRVPASGIDPELSTPIVVLSQEGRDQVITAKAVDKAGNVMTRTISGLNLDKTLPKIAIGVLNILPSQLPSDTRARLILSGWITDALSGVDPQSTTYEITDEYGQGTEGGQLSLYTAGYFTLDIRLNPERRANDGDGRQYTLTIHAKDLAGNAYQVTRVLTMP